MCAEVKFEARGVSEWELQGESIPRTHLPLRWKQETEEPTKEKERGEEEKLEINVASEARGLEEIEKGIINRAKG